MKSTAAVRWLPVVLLAPLFTTTTLHSQVESSPLPPIDSTASISEVERRLDDVLAERVKELEKDLAAVEKLLNTGRTADRIKMLEEKVQLAEERNRIERARTLGIARAKYTAGYKLLSDMELKSQGLVAAGASVSAYNSIAELTDLRKYPGFEPAFNRLLGKIKNQQERSWLTNLISSAIPALGPGAVGLASLNPIVGAAGFALAQLRNILPAFAKDKLDGNELVTTYANLMCGLNTVTKLHDDLAALAALNARWTESVEELRAKYPDAIARYRTLVDAAGNSDMEFYTAVQAKFDEHTASTPATFLQFNDNIDGQNTEFETAARTYHVVVSRHLDYWEQLKQVIVTRRDMPCLENDVETSARFNNAVADINSAIAEIRNAYMFESNLRPENDYFRRVIAGAR